MNKTFFFLPLLVAQFFVGAQCTLSAFPGQLVAGSTSVITVTYFSKLELSDSIIINCGNGRSVAAFGCAPPGGYCSATCPYPFAGNFQAAATVDGGSCSPASIAVNNPSARCGDGVCQRDIGESPQTCPLDCGQLYYCGDGICSAGESPDTCAADCGGPVTTCSDGTRFSTCSATLPYYCQGGTLVPKASQCGCPAGKIASGDDCVEPTCIDGTAKAACSLKKQLYCNGDYSLVEKSSYCGCPLGKTAVGDTCTGPGSCQLVSAYAIDTSRTVAKGTDAYYQFMISNPSGSTQQASISAVFPKGLSGSFSASSFQLSAGEYARPQLAVKTAGATPGTYSISASVDSFNCHMAFPVSLTVSSSNETGGCCSESRRLSASMDQPEPVLAHPADTVKYTVYLRNDAASAVSVSLSADSSPFTPAFSKNGFDMEAGATDAVTVQFRIPANTPGNQFSIPVMVRYSTTCCVREFPLVAFISVAGPRAALSMISEPAPECASIPQYGGEKSISLGLRNDGDAEDTFNIVVSEKFPLYGNARASQSSLHLKSGETGFLTIFLSPANLEPNYTYTYSFEAKLGIYSILFRNYCFKVVPPAGVATPTPSAGSLPLKVEAPDMAVVAGVSQSFDMRVTNPTAALFDDLSLRLDGVPEQWYSFSCKGASLPAYSSKIYRVTVSAPAALSSSSYLYANFVLLSGGQAAGAANSTLEVLPAARQLDYSYIVTPVVTDGTKVSVLQVKISVENKGNVAEYGIAPEVPYQEGLNYSVSPAKMDLRPGETGIFDVLFWPSGQSSESASVPISFSSRAGSTATKSISIPSMTGLALLGRGLPWWAYALSATILLVIAMIIIARYKEPGRMA